MLSSRRGFTIGRHPRRGRAGRVNDIVAVTELIDAVREPGFDLGADAAGAINLLAL